MAFNDQDVPKRALAQTAAIWKSATADGNRAAQRLLDASRTVATHRFETFWPSLISQRGQVRTALRQWYLHTVEAQLTRALHGQQTWFDGNRAEDTATVIENRTQVPRATAMTVVLATGYDAAQVGAELGRAELQLLDAAVTGKVAENFPRSNRLRIGQAMAEQWYARCFRAAVAPMVHHSTEPPVTELEARQFATALAGGPHRLYDNGHPLVLGNDWREHAHLAWTGMLNDQRKQWLEQRRFDPEHRTKEFEDLPPLTQVTLVRQHPPTKVRGFAPDPIATQGGPAEQAAAMFDTQPIPPATAIHREMAHRLTRRGRPAIPNDLLTLPAKADVADALITLREQSQGSPRQLTGLSQQRRMTDEELRTAIELRREGTAYTEISQTLGYAPSTISQRVRDSGRLTETELQGGRHRFTENELQLARALHTTGMTTQAIGLMWGVEPASLRTALKRDHQERARKQQENRELPTDSEVEESRQVSEAAFPNPPRAQPPPRMKTARRPEVDPSRDRDQPER